MSERPKFRCPESMQPHALRVLAGEYDVPRLEFAGDGRPAVLDIGANVGAFSVWAKRRWPEATIIAFEPHPDNYELLLANCAHLGDAFGSQRMAVADRTQLTEYPRLRLGRNNCGECSLHDLGEQLEDSVPVEIADPEMLRACDVLKIDTEGCELEILQLYHHLPVVRAVLLEWHRRKDRWSIGKLLSDAGLVCYDDRPRSLDRGVMKWVRLEDA